ncbi:hypothetical protein [Pseudomonas cremoricolorata]|uniref:Uncharacterized protein n=1 Tax=Pseudomonas cremoricolorata TaxID=157783 RepID=A0A089YB33_9PSED|nr:hypothetical protein [Pseudomonas cremoricolorata]AIR89028.1 hypothetical protein LK03_06980 [Pseudomonas cremoricolorata]
MNALVNFDSCSRPDAWAAHTALVQVNYEIRVEAEPDSLCRILNLFALQSLTPHHVQASQEDDHFLVHIAVGGLTWHRAELIGHKLRNLVCVAEVSLQGAGKIL